MSRNQPVMERRRGNRKKQRRIYQSQLTIYGGEKMQPFQYRTKMVRHREVSKRKGLT